MSGYNQNYQQAHPSEYQNYQQAHPSEYQNYQQAHPSEYQNRKPEEYNEPASAVVTDEKKASKYPSPEQPAKRHILPTWTHEGRLHTKGINPEGESGRAGFHPVHFFRVAWHSATPWNKWLNILWPFVPAAIVLHFVYGTHHTAIFAVNYVAMVPAASLLGFAGQELARKMPRVIGILVETTLGSVVEIVLFTVLIVRDGVGGNLIPVIKAAILGSILTNLLLCLGFCFLVGGMKWKEQTFHPVVSETGSGLLLVAGFGLLIPTAFYSAMSNSVVAAGQTGFTEQQLIHHTDRVSHGTAIVLMVAFFMYIAFSIFSHDSIFDEVLRQDEEADNDRERDLAKQKFTLTEAVIAIIFSLACISLISIFLVFEIEPIVHERHVPDNFMGLILVPLVEKIAEHITAVDEAYDNQIVSMIVLLG